MKRGDKMPIVPILEPLNGEVLNHAQGYESGGLYFALKAGGTPILLTHRLNQIETNGESRTVIWDCGSFPRYSFLIDDNMYWLEELCRNRPRSLFEQFYLGGLKRLHIRYGTRFLLNVFYRNKDGSFDLGMFPECYREEFTDNADWLRIAFHAESELPTRPYAEGKPDSLVNAYEAVRKEVWRFAGEKVFSPPQIIHFYQVTPEGRCYLARQGMQALSVSSGEFEQLSARIGRTVNAFQESEIIPILRMPLEFFCNNLSCGEIQARLAGLIADPVKDYINIGTHEQYFYPFYSNYISDHFRRLETALRILTEAGYQPVWANEGIFGNLYWNYKG